MKIHFVSPGPFKSESYRDLCQEYLKRAGRFAETEFSEHRFQEEKDLSAWLRKRGARALLTILDERGHLFETRAFAEKIEKIKNRAPTEWIVLLGTDRGLSASFKAEFKTMTTFEWSLSPLTMAHELAATVACEQIYRALSLAAGHPYHRD